MSAASNESDPFAGLEDPSPVETASGSVGGASGSVGGPGDSVRGSVREPSSSLGDAGGSGPPIAARGERDRATGRRPAPPAVFLVSPRLPTRVRDEIRIATGALGAVAMDLSEGMSIPPGAVAIIGVLPAGARRVPQDLARLAARSALRLVLCAVEQMARPVTTLLGGRVILIAPPFDPQRLRWGLRAAAVGGSEAARFGGDAGQSLGAEWWLAWARYPGHSATVQAIESAIDITVVVGPGVTAPLTEQAGDVIRTAADDEALERDLTSTVGDNPVVRLAATLGEWVVYWPPTSGELWLCSPWRAPAQWCVSRGIAASGRRVAHIPAYPQDVMVLCDHVPALEGIIGAVERGTTEAYAVLRAAAAEARLIGAILEAR